MDHPYWEAGTPLRHFGPWAMHARTVEKAEAQNSGREPGMSMKKQIKSNAFMASCAACCFTKEIRIDCVQPMSNMSKSKTRKGKESKLFLFLVPLLPSTQINDEKLLVIGKK